MNSHRFACRKLSNRVNRWRTWDGRRAFLRALERFQGVKSLFLQLDRPIAWFDRAPEISKSAEIFGNDCEIQVTLPDPKKYYFSDICMYILAN